MNNPRNILDAGAIDKALSRIAHEILERNESPGKLAVVGIKLRGEFLAKRIKEKINAISETNISMGALDINLYRDDLSEVAEQPVLRGTDIDFDVNGMNIILVDDVLFTGRTIRCALDQLIDFGRPNNIQLAVLIDRGHRELPIRPDYVGKNVPTSKSQQIEVRLKESEGKDEVVISEKGDI
jgi:pyrimidine operon attenuation protein/uracil phosphoribosyltransferase